MEQAQTIDWDRAPTRALHDTGGPVPQWYADGLINTCWNAVDRHVAAGHGERLALIHDSPVTGAVARITYAELQDRVARLAGVLSARGIGVGDRVIVYMPMVPEAIEAMLACTRIGAIHSVVFGGFAAAELAVRIDDAQPRADPRRLLRDRAGPGGALQAAPRRGPRPRRPRAGVLPAAAAPAGPRRHGRRGTSTGPERWRRRRPRPACPWPATIRPTSSTPPARPARPRAWSAPPAGISSRWTGRWPTSTA